MAQRIESLTNLIHASKEMILPVMILPLPINI